MAIAKCIFCGLEQEDFKGTYLIKNEGAVVYYCSAKCIKNQLGLKRDSRKTGWTEAFRVARGKRLGKEALAKEALTKKAK